MSFQSFRSFLETLAEKGQLVTIGDAIYPEPDVRTYLRAAADVGDQGPALIFDNIKGYRGMKLAGNIHGSWANHAVMLGMDVGASIRDQFFKIDEKWENIDGGGLQWVDNASCQEVIIEKNINLYQLLPLYRINLNDGGFYLGKSCVVSRDPEDPENLDKENVGCYRLQVQSPSTLGLQVAPFHDLGLQIHRAEKEGVNLPIAICLGNPPFVTSMSATPLEYDQSEYKVASALMGEPLEVTKCIGSNMDVPAGSEMVLEGEIISRKRIPEGPFGEFPGGYSGVRAQFRVKINRVTHRKNYIFENIYIGRPWTEHDTLIGLWTSMSIYRQLRERIPEVACVNALYQHGMSIVVSTDVRTGGYGKIVALLLSSTPHGAAYAKNIIIVDADVDPFNHYEVMWALSTRVRGAKDIFMIPNTPGVHLAPASEPPGMDTKLVIDATTPVPPDTANEAIMCERLETHSIKEKISKLQKEVSCALS